MKITKIREDIDKLPKCSALLSRQTREFWRGRGRPGNEKGKKTCDSRASYKIGKKHYCAKHAGLFLLKIFDKIEITQ